MSIIEQNHLKFTELTTELLNRSFCFSCGDDDLDDFFNNEAILYRENLMGKTYCFVKVLSSDEFKKFGKEYKICAAFTVANDSLRVYDLPNNRKKKLIESTHKHLKRYPGVLVGRLGVSQELCNQGYGSEILAYVKRWFSEPENKTGCRFIFLFSSDEQELFYERGEKCSGEKPATRLMFFDLLKLSD